MLAALLNRVAVAAEAQPIELVGYASLRHESLFVLYDQSTQVCSPWLKLGQVWHGCVLVAFDPKSELVGLKCDQRRFTLGLRRSAQAGAVYLPALANGTFTLLDGSVVYSPDAQLKLANGTVISSPNGVMVSDRRQKFVQGDLTVVTARSTVQALNARMDLTPGEMKLTAESVSISTTRP